MRYYYTSIRMAKIKKNNDNINSDAKKVDYSCIGSENVKWYRYSEKQFGRQKYFKLK